MTSLKVQVEGVYVGTPKPFGDRPGLESAFIKDEVSGAVAAEPGLLHGDESANEKHHGGPDRVIHHYPAENYQIWRELYPEYAEGFQPGTFGENLSTTGVVETDVCIGDVFSLGSCKVQLTEGRKPCGFIDVRYGIKGIFREIQKQVKMGWFYRVLEAGEFSKGDTLELIERPYEKAGLHQVSELIMNQSKDQELAEFLSQVDSLSDRWKEKLSKLSF